MGASRHEAAPPVNEVLRALRRRWILVLLLTLLTTAAAVGYASTREPEYEAYVTYAVGARIAEDNGGAFVRPEDLDYILATFARRANSVVNRDAAASILGRPLPAEISATSESGSGILTIYARAASSRDAVDSVRAAGEALAERIDRSALVRIELLDPPAPIDGRVGAAPAVTAGAGLVLGLLLGLGAALLAERVRRRIERREDIAELTDVPIIGTVPSERSIRKHGGVAWDASHEIFQESVRTLRANLDHLDYGERPVIQVTSATPGQGKTTIVANLGVALARMGARTLLIDADLRSPRLHTVLGVSGDPGLTNLLSLADPRQSRDAMPALPLATDIEGLDIVPSGPFMHDAPELLQLRLRSVLEPLREGYDVVLVDSPPVGSVADPLVIARLVTTVVAVTSIGERAADLRAALAALTMARAPLRGIVVNRVADVWLPYAYAAPLRA